MHLLFLPGFTVDPGAFDEPDFGTDAENGDAAAAADGGGGGGGSGGHGELMYALQHPGAVWAPGVFGVDEELVVRSPAYDRNRAEVLRLFLALLCEPLFVPADLFDPARRGHGPWAAAATRPGVPLAPLLFASLLNTVVDFDPVGWGVPYGANVVRAGRPAQVICAARYSLPRPSRRTRALCCALGGG